ncbi:MAG: type IV pili twitching motility protein PilT [Chloroflexi bacterium RBG_13_51_52]|nr:MAG: type IV pili twitching motility protein PilT [Chloroflexi bacterium RBG_13_51_52]
MTDIVKLLQLGKQKSASDLHVVVSMPPLYRIHGSLVPADDMPVLSSEEIEQALKSITTEKEMADFTRDLELDFGRTVPEVGRVRFNAARQRGSISLVARLLPSSIPAPDELGLPKVCKELIKRPRGLVVISGPTGSGKSTTLASMIEYLNQTESRRVITIEDPIEYTYENKKCTITQRELGHDTLSFAEALRHVLRQDPDVILVGEMRDLETASTALTVAETGHLVLTTGHAPSASQAVERIANMFPPHERTLAQTRLASLLLGILCQALVPKADGSGRVAAIEVMLANSAIRNLIRDGKTFQLPNAIRMSTQQGMELLDQALVRLYRNGAIKRDMVFDFCNDRDEITRLTGERDDAQKKEQEPVLNTQFN